MQKDKKTGLERIKNPASKADAKVLIEENKFRNFRNRLKTILRKSEKIATSSAVIREKSKEVR